MASSVSVSTPPTPASLLTPSTKQVAQAAADDKAPLAQAQPDSDSTVATNSGAASPSATPAAVSNGSSTAANALSVVSDDPTEQAGEKSVATASQTSAVEASPKAAADAEIAKAKSTTEEAELETETEVPERNQTASESATSATAQLVASPQASQIAEQATTAVLLSTAASNTPRSAVSDRPVDAAQATAPATEAEQNSAVAKIDIAAALSSSTSANQASPTLTLSNPSLTATSEAAAANEPQTASQLQVASPSSQLSAQTSSLTTPTQSSATQTSPTVLGAVQTSTATAVGNGSTETVAANSSTSSGISSPTSTASTNSQTSADITASTTVTTTQSEQNTTALSAPVFAENGDFAALQKEEVSPTNDLTQATLVPSVLFKRSGTLAQGAADLYQFSVDETGIFTADLTGLSADADVQLIQDKNGNGQVDNGEIVAWEWEHNQTDESIRHFLQKGNYVLRVIDKDTTSVETKYTVATSFTASAVDDRAFSIEVIYKLGSEQLNTEARAAVARAADFWENAISHSSFDRPLELALGIYGTTNETNPFLAYAGPQSYRNTGDNLLPVVGVAVLNNLYLDDYNQNPDYLESVLRHELGHVLGLGVIWDKRGNDLVDQDKGVYRANSYAGQAYGELLGTGIATDIPLDVESLTHWDEEIFDEELMTPRAEGIGTPLPLSQLSLSSLRDIGWHVNYGAADDFSLDASVVA